MKIVRLFSRLNVGGPALHVVNLTFGLEYKNCETILVVGSISSDEGDMSYYATQKGITPVVIPEFQAPISLLKDVIAFIKILKLIHREKPDVVHTHTFKAGLLGRIAAWLCRVPYIVHTYHGHLLEGYGRPQKARIIAGVEKFLSYITDQVIAVSSLVSKDLVQHKIIPQKKMNVVELGFDIDALIEEAKKPSSLRQKMGFTKEDVVVGIAGRLVPVKSVELFLKSVAPLFKEFPRLKVVVLGDGGERSRLEALAQALSPKIFFTGWMLPLHPEFKDIDLLICSSKNEGTSVSVIESVICGVPVISTRVGGMSDLLNQGEWGDLVSYDQAELTQKIRERVQILCEPQSDDYQIYKQRTLAAQKKFYERFHMNRLVEDIYQIYQRPPEL